jgi:hypothetical protein
MTDLKPIFRSYATFGKTGPQAAAIKDNDLKIETKNIQKWCKESGVINPKYASQLLDNDISKFRSSFF